MWFFGLFSGAIHNYPILMGLDAMLSRLLFECFGVPCNPATKIQMYINNIYVYIYTHIITVLAIHNYILLDMKTTQAYMQKYDANMNISYTGPVNTTNFDRKFQRRASLSSAAMPAKTAKTKKAFLDEKAVQ